MTQAADRKPFAWMNDISRKYLANGYLVGGQSGEARVAVIAETAAKRLGRRDLAAKIYEYASHGWYSFSSPVWSNFGLTRGLPISCYSTFCGDSIESILDAHYEICTMSKHGGGTSIYINPVRPRGAAITDNGESSGSVHLAQIFDTGIRTINQGSTRRGEAAAYWDIDHPDVPEALRQIRTDEGEIKKLTYGLCVSDAWMRDLIAGDARKRDLWSDVAKQRQAKGFPYLIFIDNANRQAPPEYKQHGLRINSSNLCVTGDQRVPSSRGLKTAAELHRDGGDLVLFDNESPVNASPMRLIEQDADVHRITLDNGMTHTVTSYHKVKVRTSPSGRPEQCDDRACADLKPGDLVAVQTEKGVFGKTHMPQEAFLLGLYQGDGTQTDTLISIEIWEKTFDLEDEIQSSFNEVCDRHNLRVGTNRRVYGRAKFHECVVSQSPVRKRRLISTALKKFGFQKGFIPAWVWEGDEETQWQYIRGLLYTDGTVNVGKSLGNPLQLSISAVDHKLLSEVQLIMTNLGLQTTIRKLRDAGETMLPDGRGGNKLYKTQKCWRLIISNKADALEVERKTGFLTRKGVVLEDREYRDNTKKFYAVVSVEHVGKEDVYCCMVDTDAHHWVCNGVITRNCTEIFLSTSQDESFVCCLSSMNMLHYQEWKDTDAVEVMMYVLEAVMGEFVEKARSIKGFERAVRFAERQRALGLGQIGWHTYLQSQMIPYDSPAATGMTVEASRRIQQQCAFASSKMASEYGEPYYLKGSGRRHMTFTAIAPTQSSAAIIGQVSEGIEMMGANFVVKDKQKVKYVYKNPLLLSLLGGKGRDTADVIDSIFEMEGSVQHLDCLTGEEKAVFRTVRETHPMSVVRQAAARQPFICQGQSLNLFMPPGMTPKESNEVVIAAWRLGLKSLYYQHNVSAVRDLANNLPECAACSG